jgi:hypothetical protein
VFGVQWSDFHTGTFWTEYSGVVACLDAGDARRGGRVSFATNAFHSAWLGHDAFLRAHRTDSRRSSATTYTAASADAFCGDAGGSASAIGIHRTDDGCRDRHASVSSDRRSRFQTKPFGAAVQAGSVALGSTSLDTDRATVSRAIRSRWIPSAVDELRIDRGP